MISTELPIFISHSGQQMEPRLISNRQDGIQSGLPADVHLTRPDHLPIALCKRAYVSPAVYHCRYCTFVSSGKVPLCLFINGFLWILHDLQ